MQLQTLYIRNFRNWAEAELSFSPGINLFYGDNGQGKTNLLEAIYLIATGRSFRTARLQELIRAGETFFFLEARLIKDGISHTVQISFDGKVKKLNLDGNAFGNLQHLLGHLPSVLYTPYDAELSDGSPAIRRRFLNLHLAQRDPLYIHHLTRYWRAMKQRNALLRGDTRAIDCWEMEMAESGGYLLKTRMQCIADLTASFSDRGHILSDRKETHEIRFQPGMQADHYLQQLRKNRPREKQLGMTLAGPHRDDFSLWIDGKSAREYASEGQKKTAAFALRLAEWELLSKATEATALFGIDDLSFHLDDARLRSFAGTLAKLGQVFITAPRLTQEMERSALFCVKAGQINTHFG